ncbi:MAG: ribosome small subunit-dependent GTPase A [bacterium]
MAKGKRKRKAGGHARARPRPGRIHEETADDDPRREKVFRGRQNAPALPEEASVGELAGDVRDGRVVALFGGEILVEPAAGGEPVTAHLRKSTRVPHRGANPVTVGDFVRYLEGAVPPHVLTEVLPRRTHLTRLRHGGQSQVVCANVDLGVVVGSAAEPPFKPRLVDRYVISFRLGGLAPALVLNKVDLVGPGGIDEWLALYRSLGVEAVGVSAATGAGVSALEAMLRGKTSVFAGQSGVGKSSLLNRLAGLDLRTADVYGKLGKGRHTTTSSTLYRLPSGGEVIDTPGVRSFGLPPVTREAVHEFFPEIEEAARGCRFGDCRHSGDEGCAVEEAVRAGRIPVDRLDSFLALREEGVGRAR